MFHNLSVVMPTEAHDKPDPQVLSHCCMMLPLHSYMSSMLARSQRTLSLTAIAVARASAFSCTCSPRPTSFRVAWEGWVTPGLYYRRWTLVLRIQNLLCWMVSKLTLCFEGTHCLYLPRLFAIQKSLGEMVQNKGTFASAHRHGETPETLGELFPRSR